MAQLWFDKGWGDARLQGAYVKAIDGTTYTCGTFMGDGDGLNLQDTWSVHGVKEKAILHGAYDSNNNGANAFNAGGITFDGKLIAGTADGKFYYPYSTPGAWFLYNFSICNGALFAVASNNYLIYSYKPFWNGQAEWRHAAGFSSWVKKILRVSDFGNSCNFLLTTGGSIAKIDAWNHCGGLAWIGPKDNFIDAGTDGIDVWGIDRQNNLWWFNGYGGYAQSKCNAPGGGVVAIYVNPRGPPCTVGVIALDGCVYFAHSKHTVLYGESIVWAKGGLTKLLTRDVKDPGDRIKWRPVDFSDSTAYISANPWMDLTKPNSNPRFGKDMISDNSLVSSKGSVIYKLSQNGISNFYPYKIVSLADLISSNRAVIAAYQTGDGSFTPANRGFRMALMLFYPDDQYLPVGDVCISDNYTDYTKVWVALIRNLPEYCIPNSDEDVSTQFSGWGRKDHRGGFDLFGNWTTTRSNLNYNWSIASPTTVTSRDTFKKSNNVKGQNISVGDMAQTVNAVVSNPVGLRNNPPIIGTPSWLLRRWGDNINPVQGIKPTSVRTFALVNPTYVARIAQNNLNSAVISAWPNGAFGIHEGNGIYSISYFNTFGAGRTSAGNPLAQTLFDFLPEVYVAALCGKGDTITKWGYTNSTRPVSISGADCPSWMNKWMSRDKYENAPSDISKEWCRGDGVGQCDTNLYAFCQEGPDGKQYNFNASVPWKRLPPDGIPRTSTPDDLAKMYPNSSNTICTAFMPEDYYIARDYYPLHSKNDTKELDIITQVISKGGYKYAECTPYGSQSNGVNTNRFMKAGSNSCPSIAICTNNVNMSAKGATFNNSPINITQSNECGGTGGNKAEAPITTQLNATNTPAAPPPSIKDNPPAGKLPPPVTTPKPPPVVTSTKKPSSPPVVTSTKKPSSPQSKASTTQKEWYENCSIM